MLTGLSWWLFALALKKMCVWWLSLSLMDRYYHNCHIVLMMIPMIRMNQWNQHSKDYLVSFSLLLSLQKVFSIAMMLPTWVASTLDSTRLGFQMFDTVPFGGWRVLHVLLASAQISKLQQPRPENFLYKDRLCNVLHCLIQYIDIDMYMCINIYIYKQIIYIYMYIHCTAYTYLEPGSKE